MNIIFYSSHCPKCKMLMALMDKKQIKYSVIDDENIYLPIADENGIESMPFANVDGKILNTKELQQYIQNM